MKVIFLDIDGVLNNHQTKGMIDNECLENLLHIIKNTDAKVVISSSWKDEITFAEEKHAVSSWLDTLINNSELHIIDKTPDIDEDNREKEIIAWINEHETEIKSFVIIDDIDYNFSELFGNKFIKTAGYWGSGLTKDHALEAIRMLNQT